MSCGSLLLCPGSWCTQISVCALQESFSAVLCKFWQLYGGVNSDLLKEGLCHTQVYCTQRPCPHSSPLLTHTSLEDTQTQFCLSLFGVSGSWCTQVCLSPLSISGGYGVWFYPWSWASCHLVGAFPCPETWGISSKSPQHHTATVPAPTILLELLCPWMCSKSSHSCSGHTAYN